MKRICLILIVILLFASLGCGKQKDEPATPLITPSFGDVDAIEKHDSGETVWLEPENAVLYRANLCSAMQQNLFALYFDEGDGFAYFHIDNPWVKIEPFICPRSMVQADMDTEDEYIEIVLCVARDETTDYTYVFGFNGDIITLFEGEGTLEKVSGNTLTLSTGEFTVDLSQR